MPSVDERLEKFINKTDTCWLWIGAKTDKGYGTFHYEGRMVVAHRFVYERYVGPIPEGLHLDHLCLTKACVRPEHLDPVTSWTNTRRHYDQITNCPKGHEYTEANTRIYKGRRWCRECDRIRSQKARDRKRV